MVNFSDRQRSLKAKRSVKPGERLPVFEGKLVVRNGTATYEVPLGPRQARALPALSEVSSADEIEVLGTPTGDVIVTAPYGAARVHVHEAGRKRTMRLAKGALRHIPRRPTTKPRAS